MVGTDIAICIEKDTSKKSPAQKACDERCSTKEIVKEVKKGGKREHSQNIRH